VDHSYEEIGDAALDVLVGRVKPKHGAQQYETLRVGVAEALARRDEPENPQAARRPPVLSHPDNELFLEVFWGLFREGIITLGYNDANRDFPFFRLTQWGRRQLEDGEGVFFAADAALEANVRERLKRADDATVGYLSEAMRSLREGAALAALALLGVAVEDLCERLLKAAGDEAEGGGPGAAARGTLLQRIAAFKERLDREPALVPAPMRDDFGPQLVGVMSILSALRDEAGRPRAEAPDREQIYVLLKAAIDYAHGLIDLTLHLSEAPAVVVRQTALRAGASA
jgi:hypothetical protein